MIRWDDMGLKDVWLANGYERVKTPYGSGLRFDDVGGLTRWEKSGRVPKWANRMIRLVFEAHADGNAAIRRVVNRINDVDRLVHQRIVLEQSPKGWHARAAEDAGAAA